LHHAKRALVDWHAAVFPGAVLPPATLLERALGDELGHGAARLALGRHASPRAAALINGTAAHTAEVDDIFREAIYHPGAPTIAAALALAQARGLSGLALLRAVIVGYEVSTRIGATMGRATMYWHSTGHRLLCAAAAQRGSNSTPRFAHALATAATCWRHRQTFLQRLDVQAAARRRAAEAGAIATRLRRWRDRALDVPEARRPGHAMVLTDG
jgi:2-methylcitrate dehydratase PrpD